MIFLLNLFEPGKQQGKPPLLDFILKKHCTKQKETLQLSLSEARTRRKTKNRYTQESTQERKTDRLFLEIQV